MFLAGWDVPTGATSTKGETMCNSEKCEKYNGWANRETWALNLWLSNDVGLYDLTRERVRDAMRLVSDEGPLFAVTGESADRYRERVTGDAVKSFWDELTDPAEGLMDCEAILSMVRDVGSAWRVDWNEIGAAWLEGVDES